MDFRFLDRPSEAPPDASIFPLALCFYSSAPSLLRSSVFLMFPQLLHAAFLDNTNEFAEESVRTAPIH